LSPAKLLPAANYPLHSDKLNIDEDVLPIGAALHAQFVLDFLINSYFLFPQTIDNSFVANQNNYSKTRELRGFS